MILQKDISLAFGIIGGDLQWSPAKVPTVRRETTTQETKEFF